MMPTAIERIKIRCYKCNEQFNMKEDLKSHLMVFHLSWTPYKCEKCPEMRVPTVESLKKHQKCRHPDWSKNRTIIYYFDEEKEAELKEIFARSTQIQLQTERDVAVPLMLESTSPDLLTLPLPSLNDTENNSEDSLPEDSVTTLTDEIADQDVSSDRKFLMEFIGISGSGKSSNLTEFEGEIDATSTTDVDLMYDLIKQPFHTPLTLNRCLVSESALSVTQKRIGEPLDKKENLQDMSSYKRSKVSSLTPFPLEGIQKPESIVTEDATGLKVENSNDLPMLTPFCAESAVTENEATLLNSSLNQSDAEPESKLFSRSTKGNTVKWWQNYEYHMNHKTLKKWYWACAEKGRLKCPGLLHTKPGGVSAEKTRGVHNHQSDEHSFRAKVAYEDMRKEAVTTRKRCSLIVDDICAKLTDEEKQRLPGRMALIRRVQKYRADVKS